MKLLHSRNLVQVSLIAGAFFLAFVSAPLFGADEISIFPGGENAPQADPGDDDFSGFDASDPAPVSEVPADVTADPEPQTGPLNLDIGRLDRSGRSSSIRVDRGSAAAPVRKRVEVRVVPGAARQPAAMPELESLPLPEGVELGENDVLAKSALTEIPKGEGYEATVSANSQGKLISLGRQKKDENGQPVFDEDENPVMIPMYRGMMVEEGDILGVQFNQAFHARKAAAERELEVAKKEAGKQLEVEVAEASKNVALMEYKRAVNANKRVPNSVSEDEVWQKRFEWYRGMKSEDKAKYDLEIAELAVHVKEAAIAVADAELEERLIRSPLSGQVDDIFKNRGEWLREGDNVLHILRLDKINITANFDSTSVSPSDIEGKAVTVYVSKAGMEPQVMEGGITYARPVLMMNRFVAYAEVKNIQIGESWLLMPGMRVNLIVHKDKPYVANDEGAASGEAAAPEETAAPQ